MPTFLLLATLYFLAHAGCSDLAKDRLGDDYCDCPGDGSDEPASAACPISARFYCKNEVSPQFLGINLSRKIPGNWVNDGVCDCCDGTDEFASWVICQEACTELAERELKLREEVIKEQALAMAERKALQQRGRILVQKLRARLALLSSGSSKRRPKSAKKTHQDPEARSTVCGGAKDCVVVTTHKGDEVISKPRSELTVEFIRQSLGGGVMELVHENFWLAQLEYTLEAYRVPSGARILLVPREQAFVFPKRVVETTKVDSQTVALKRLLMWDFGEDYEYFPLVGECFALHEAKLKFELCPFENFTVTVDGTSTTGHLLVVRREHENKELRLVHEYATTGNSSNHTTVHFTCASSPQLVSITRVGSDGYNATLQTAAACVL